MKSMLFRMGPAMGVFYLWMMGSVLGAIFSNGVFGVWFFMECSFAGVVCIVSGSSIEENEGAMKYFIFQALGALVLFFGLVVVVCGGLYSFVVGFYLVFMGFCIKVGLFPFSFWVPAVTSLFSWPSIFYVGWVQKVPVLWLLCLFGVPFSWSTIFQEVVWFTVLVGCVGGVGVQCYRTLIGYSSLVHSGWMVMLSISSLVGLCFYLFIYGVLLSAVVYKMSYFNLYSWEDHCRLSSEYCGVPLTCWQMELLKLSLFMDMASLSGFPPLLGSAAKVIGVYYLWESYWVSAIVLVFSSCITFIYYFSLMSNSMMSVGKGVWSLKKPVGTPRMGRPFSGYFPLSYSLCLGMQLFGGLFLLLLVGVL